jgi:hypothetical protein
MGTLSHVRTSLFGSRRRKLATLLTIAALVGTAAGLAAWIVNVTNPPANTKVGTLATPTASASTVYPTGVCYPSQTCARETKLTTPGTTTEHLAGWTAGSVTAASAITGASGSCASADFTANYTIPAVTLATPVVLQPGPNDVVLTGFFAVGANLPTGCQGASATLATGVQLNVTP